MTDTPDQLPLFDPNTTPLPKTAGSPDAGPALDPKTPLSEALKVYLDALRYSGASLHTVRAFRSDVGLLAQWASQHAHEDKLIGEFGTNDLNLFLRWLTQERGKPCSPKSYARRVTALKHFFGYLAEIKAIKRDPSAALIQRTVSSPLPDVLTDDDVDRVLAATQTIRAGLFGQKPDARPHLLVSLLLETGIKKSETVGLHAQDVDRDHPDGPRIWIRYANPKLRYKERRLPVSHAWVTVLDEYLAQRKSKASEIFDYTPRMLEYVLRDVAAAAHVEPSKMSFETLRWTSALRSYRAGMEPDPLRQKLGVSRVTWAKTSEKLGQLARGEMPSPPDES
jgi:integrase/recombinase XerD